MSLPVFAREFSRTAHRLPIFRTTRVNANFEVDLGNASVDWIALLIIPAKECADDGNYGGSVFTENHLGQYHYTGDCNSNVRAEDQLRRL